MKYDILSSFLKAALMWHEPDWDNSRDEHSEDDIQLQVQFQYVQ